MPRRRRLGQTAGRPTGATALDLLLTLAAVLAATAVVGALVWTRRGGGRRQRAVRGVLDAADALEARLRHARAEIQAVAGDHQPDPVGDAMREMLRQRLWLRDHGADASIDQLDRVRDSIDAARLRIDDQLDRIERARASAA